MSGRLFVVTCETGPDQPLEQVVDCGSFAAALRVARWALREGGAWVAYINRGRCPERWWTVRPGTLTRHDGDRVVVGALS